MQSNSKPLFCQTLRNGADTLFKPQSEITIAIEHVFGGCPIFSLSGTFLLLAISSPVTK